MMVANSFDLWKKDSFFAAAEEVQESADIMESSYRLWVKEKSKGIEHATFDQISSELQTALGTAKWQLEEFERAVMESHRYRCNDVTMARHRQFITAMENQISRVEAALREVCNEGRKQPLRWINLDDDERDDLAMFLSGTSSSSYVRDECNEFRPIITNPLLDNSQSNRDATPNATSIGGSSDKMKGYKDAMSNSNGECVIELEEGSSETREDIFCTADKPTSARKFCGSPNFDSLRIVIDNGDEEGQESMAHVESTPKEKGFRPMFRNLNFVDSQARAAVNLFNQVLGGLQRRRQSTVHLQFSRSVQLKLALMIMMLLLVPFVLYSA